MRTLQTLVTVVACFVVAQPILAQTQHITIKSPFDRMDDSLYTSIKPLITEPTAEISNGAAGAEQLMQLLIERGQDSSTGQVTLFSAAAPVKLKTLDDKDFYCIFHILRWSNPDANNKQTVQAQKWYLYHRGTLTLATGDEVPRLFGVKAAVFIYIHLNTREVNKYDPNYEFEIKKRVPAYISHLESLAGLFSIDPGKSSVRLTAANQSDNYFGVTTLSFDYKVADITATAKIARPTAVEVLGEAQKFDNEGKYFVDFSVGVPIRKMSELKFDSVNNTVTANKVDKTNIFAFVNIFPRPIDIRKNNVDLVPHFVGGVAIDRQPLRKIFVGTGIGPSIANFYIGALFVKQDQPTTLNTGDTATPGQLNNDLRRKYKTQVGFGLNVPVGVIIEKLKGK